MDIEKIEVDDEWEWYIGQLFFKLIENKNNINCVVELAPGFKYKVAYALKEIDFKGELYIVDSNSNVIEYVVKKYKEILPKANIVGICDDFANAINRLPDKIDLFLANHVIDDMLIENYISKTDYDKLFNLQEDGNKYLKQWEKFADDDIAQKKSIDKVVADFNNLFEEKNVEGVVISQYRSNLFFLGKDENVEKVVRQCFNKIKMLVQIDEKKIGQALKFYPFGDDERYLGDELLNNTQNEANWIVGKPKKK